MRRACLDGRVSLCMSGVAFALSGAASSVNVEGGFVRNDAHFGGGDVRVPDDAPQSFM